MTKSFYFYGYIEGEEDGDPIWKVLHDHFEKLAREDDDEQKAPYRRTDCWGQGKGVKRK